MKTTIHAIVKTVFASPVLRALKSDHPTMQSLSKTAARSLIAATALMLAGTAFAQEQADLITFEPDASGYLPDGTLAVDNLAVNSQYQSSYGVSFGYDMNNDLVADAGSSLLLENTANSNGEWGYWSTNGPTKYNTAAPGFEGQLGDWFLRQDNSAGIDRLLITYDNPVIAASGEIWDLDGGGRGAEIWEVTAYDASQNVLGQLESPMGVNHSNADSLDSKPWLWSFDFGNENEQISTILMSYTGTTSNIGPVAFNNFATSSATNNLVSPGTASGGITTPEPSFALMFGIFISIAYVIRSRAST